MEWQPIDTAPATDWDNRVLVSGYIYNDPAQGRWLDVAFIENGQWMTEHYPLYPPTHWMTPPALPEDN